MKKKLQKIRSSLVRPFTYGIVGIVPIGVVVVVLQIIYDFGGKFGSELLKLILPAQLEKFTSPPFGVMALIVLIWGFGVLLMWEETHNLNFIDFILRRIPLIGHFLSKKTREELKKSTPCVFWSTETALSAGIIRGRQTFRLNHGNEDSPITESIIIYWGDPPLFFTGRIGYFPKQVVFRVENELGDLVKAMAALGSPIQNGIRYSPWEDETPEQCIERFNALFNRAFGIK